MKQWLLSAFLVAGLCVPVQAADPLAAEMQAVYGSIKTFTGQFTQTLEHQESGSVETRNGTLLFEKPLRIRWETGEPSPELLIVNDKEVWDYLPDEELAYRYATEVVQDSRSILQVVTGQSRLDKDFDVQREKNIDGAAVLRLYPKEPTAQMVEALLHVDTQTKLLRMAEIIDFYGNSNRIVFTSLKPDTAMPAKAFVFTPPAGITIEDLQDTAIPERGLLQ